MSKGEIAAYALQLGNLKKSQSLYIFLILTQKDF